MTHRHANARNRPCSRQYCAAIRWIAHNDNSGNNDDIHAIARYLTVALVADLFTTWRELVAADVWDIRQGHPPYRLHKPLAAIAATEEE